MSRPQQRPPHLPGDPGLQHERTLLAWRRTAITAVAAALVLLRAGLGRQSPAIVVLACLLTVFAVGILLAGARRTFDFRGTTGGAIRHAPALLATFAAVLGLVALGVTL